MELQATNHKYYCSETNYYVGNRNGENYGRCEYDTWKEFYENWIPWSKSDGNDPEIDWDYNLLFRFDINQKEDDEGNKLDDYFLNLFFILQRKGIFRPVIVHSIKKEDMPYIEKTLKSAWGYVSDLWKELHEEDGE